MANRIDVNIIIPTFNRADLLRYTLDSLEPGRHPGVRMGVIVIDDGSVDGTMDMVASSYPDVLLLRNKGKGACSARNTGLAEATADFVVYLDSDDLMGEGFLAAKLDYLRKHPDVDACYGDEALFESDGAFEQENERFKYTYPVFEDETNADEHFLRYLAGHYIPSPAIVWRRSLLLAIGGHNEQLSINQDVDLFFKALFAGMKIKGIKDGTKVYIRQHIVGERVGNAGKDNRKWKDIIALRREVYRSLQENGLDKKEFLAALSHFLFHSWKEQRFANPAAAAEFLAMARKVYWPVPLKGNAAIVMLGKLLGPDKAVQLKYAVFKRD
jgi:glycosyltransferase involved in cell wall biosynthesis